MTLHFVKIARLWRLHISHKYRSALIFSFTLDAATILSPSSESTIFKPNLFYEEVHIKIANRRSTRTRTCTHANTHIHTGNIIIFHDVISVIPRETTAKDTLYALGKQKSLRYSVRLAVFTGGCKHVAGNTWRESSASMAVPK